MKTIIYRYLSKNGGVDATIVRGIVREEREGASRVNAGTRRVTSWRTIFLSLNK